MNPFAEFAIRAYVETQHDTNPGPPPTGHVESRGRAIFIAGIVAPIVSLIFVLLRAYSRIFIVKKLYPADWISFATMIAVICFSGTLLPATYNGMGRHIWDFTPELSSRMYFWIMISSEFYVLSLAGYKAALIALYLQIFGVHKKFRWVCYAVLFYTLGYLFCNLVIEVAGCQPIQKFYEPKTPGHCTNSIAQNIAFGVGHMTSDLLIAILPIPMVFKLQLRSRREKVGLAFVLGSGAIAWIVAVVRFCYAVVDLTVYDRTWIAGVTFFMSILEVNTGLICGCTPALKPLFIHVRKNSAGWTRKLSSVGGPWYWSKRRFGSTRDTAEDSKHPTLTDPFSATEKGGFTQLENVSGSSRSDNSPQGTLARDETFDPIDTRDDVEAQRSGNEKGGETPRPGIKRMTSDELFYGTGIAPRDRRPSAL